MQTGDKVIYSKFAGTDLDVAGEAHVLLKVRRNTSPQVPVAAAAQRIDIYTSEAINIAQSIWMLLCQAATLSLHSANLH